MPNIGPAELILILAIALIVFGPKKLPEIGKGIGSALREFNKARNDLMESLHTEMDRPDPVHRSFPESEETAELNHGDGYRAVPEGTAHRDLPSDSLETASADALPYGSDYHAVEGDSQPAFRTAHTDTSAAVPAHAGDARA